MFLHKKPDKPFLKKQVCPVWWRRGELNSRPKMHSHGLLRAQPEVLNSLHRAPTGGLPASVASCYILHAKLNAARSPLNDALAQAVVLLGRTAAFN